MAHCQLVSQSGQFGQRKGGENEGARSLEVGAREHGPVSLSIQQEVDLSRIVRFLFSRKRAEKLAKAEIVGVFLSIWRIMADIFM